MAEKKHEPAAGRMTDSLGRFAGKVAVVTGASRGIGRATAFALAREGATVVLAGRDAGALRSGVEELLAQDCRAIAVTCDVRRRSDVENLAETAYQRLGSVHLLVNNAGVYPVTPFLEMSEEEWDEILDTNLKGAFHTTQLFARRMIAQGVAGRIVNVSSSASVVARPGIAHYAASKAGLNHLTRVLAIELAPHGIAVNALCPGLIETERVQGLAVSAPDQHQAKMARIPMARMGSPAEMAAPILFLLSEEASYLTGSVVFADGGYNCGIPSYGPTRTTPG